MKDGVDRGAGSKKVCVLPALFVISIPAAPPSNMRLLFSTGKLAVLMRTPIYRGEVEESADDIIKNNNKSV